MSGLTSGQGGFRRNCGLEHWMLPFEDWSSERLRRMLKDAVPEDLHLDYKDKGSLLSNKKGEDISKHVSAFMNSDGGDLIYGVPEDKDETGTPIPRSNNRQVIGFEKNEVSKEQIENLITHNVSPRPGPDLFRISEIVYDQRLVFVVQVQVGIGEVWQAKDKRYYKRYNFKSEPMEHYEIELVRHRRKGPDLELIIGLDYAWNHEIQNNPSNDLDNTLRLGITNTSDVIVDSALIELWTNHGRFEYRGNEGFKPTGKKNLVHDHPYIRSPTGELAHFQLHWNSSNFGLRNIYAPIFKLSDPMPVAVFPINPPCSLFARIQAPHMLPKGYFVTVDELSFGDLKMKMLELKVEIA